MYFVWGFTGAYTLHDPTPQGLPNAPPADPGRAQDIAFRWWDPVMTYMQRFMRQKRHLGHISTHFWHGSRPVVIGPHTKCNDVHDVHDLDRSGAGPISSPIQ